MNFLATGLIFTLYRRHSTHSVKRFERSMAQGILLGSPASTSDRTRNDYAKRSLLLNRPLA
ncbi:hypothetical protein H6F50_24015 [Coleofasciculus sp. FACHB-712]|uniref:hypothetical protein n=1 Tax=Coleofasciculus sp. FACHB-712 TaxID=2692789 RepID=UPI0016860866|nr:hypothetical protein [Coleofasciculus sp. FACHB-712]MBD1945376.1 hypothetical protein [Coleofasciculus sp. FACHB-712]